ncbi:MAG: hypothetical protein VR66_07365 [Peptococcaceae bacterium BRH_c23]|nr:MAG: hypothetical protein VR66_07365 [Peptococcaceae bacterium BRH_c23]KJS86049.1 MAG: hypothetical protein JL57_17290 [Desulfosporosinus sp. BICA1-9]HBW34896.1 hypothetical protein [Desulfosporosinus sp.]
MAGGDHASVGGFARPCAQPRFGWEALEPSLASHSRKGFAPCFATSLGSRWGLERSWGDDDHGWQGAVMARRTTYRIGCLESESKGLSSEGLSFQVWVNKEGEIAKINCVRVLK